MIISRFEIPWPRLVLTLDESLPRISGMLHSVSGVVCRIMGVLASCRSLFRLLSLLPLFSGAAGVQACWVMTILSSVGLWLPLH